MTDDQFDLLARLMRMPDGPARDTVRLVLVDDLAVADAARQAGASYKAGWAAVNRAREWLEAARRVVG